MDDTATATEPKTILAEATTFATPTTPDPIDDEPDDDEGSTPVERPQDVDLADWLGASDVAELVDFFVLHNSKRIKIAAITDREENRIREASKKVNPANPKGPRRVNAALWRNTLIATSINKASGRREGDPGFVTAEALKGRPTGELTSIQGAIMKLSGFDEDLMGGKAEDASELFI